MARAKAVIGLAFTFALAAAPAPRKPPPPPPLQPGESLAVAGPDHEIYDYGDSRVEGPMGGLSHLLWVKLEGDAWASGDMQFKCAGAAGPFRCSAPKGHGRVDLVKALQSSCDLAFMAWAHMSADRWAIDYGDGPARARLLDTFGPFLGHRLPDGDGVPDLGLAWFGQGDLLRTSPYALLTWLVDPSQEETVRLYRRLFLSFYDGLFKDNAWWVDPEVAAAPGGLQQAWAVGGNGAVTAVLRLPPGSTRAQAQARFLAILIGQPKKK